FFFFSFCLRKFIAKLPDKGKKISDFAEKLKLAISQEEELARKAELLSAVRLEFQAKQEEINTSKQGDQDTLSCEDSSVFNENSNTKDASEVSSERQEAEDATSTALENHRTQRKNDKVKTVTEDQNHFSEVVSKSAVSSHLKNGQQVSQSNTEDATESPAALDNSKVSLID
ncbi:GRL1A polymerase, partial [Pitta sordida]|nr:GRL1A polymerase [Pitta sordida]